MGYVINPFAHGAAAFSPTDISDLICWFDAGAGITLNSGNVSDWEDQSGNANDLAQSTATDQPLYTATNADLNNMPSVDFDGVTEFMETAGFAGGDLSQPNTLFFAGKRNDSTASRYVYDGLTSSKRHAFYTLSNNATHFAGVNLSGSTYGTGAHVFGSQWNSGSSKIFKDGGTADASGDNGSFALAGLTVGAKFDHTSELDFDLAELILYDKLLSDTEMNDVGNYLADKYGTTWTDI